MRNPDILRMELNGNTVQKEDLEALWLSRSYGHFTVLPVYDAKVRGLKLHLERLQRDAQTLYGYNLECPRVLTLIRHAVDRIALPLSVRLDIVSCQMHDDFSQRPVAPDILITVRPMQNVVPLPLRVQSMCYERDLPRVKHAGTFGLTYMYHLARLNGFDDALFTDSSGYISEGSAWNICFFDGRQIIWPSAPALPGIAMQLVQAGLKKYSIPFEVRDVRIQDLSLFRSAFLTNVLVGIQAIASIDAVTFSIDADLNATLKKCYDSNQAELI